jgi:glucose-6-phosphate isomerase
MGSNGKSVTLIGTEVTRATGPLYWVKPGADDQDPCHQFMQQGTTMVPCDFIVFGPAAGDLKAHHDASVANVFAQAEALAFGISPHDVKAQGVPEWLVPHLVLEGNRPSNIILLDRLSPETLGKLIALYEHCAFTQGVIWNINPFDQWGMELRASFAERIATELSGIDEPQLGHDSSTNALIRRYRKLQSS